MAEPTEGAIVTDEPMGENGDDAMVSSVAELRQRMVQSQAHMAELEQRERDDIVQVLAMLGGEPRSYRR